MSLCLSKRSGKLSHSEIRSMSVECEKVNGINLSQGVCDLELPLPVKQGASNAIETGDNSYSRHDGTNELRNAIAKKARTYNKINADPEKNVVVSSGATGAFYSACLALLNPGDEVIIFEPFYGYHVTTLIAAEAVPVYVTLKAPNWEFDIQDLESVVTYRTKGILICTPSNPCGKVFSYDELKLLANFSIKHDIFVFTDEIYEYFVYGEATHISPGSLTEISDRTITISGYSKTFSVTGWRIGYVICNEKWAEMIGYVNDLIYVCGPTPLQAGVAQGINQLPDYFYKQLCSQYFDKREQLCGVLMTVGIMPHIPEGAYYVLADVSKIPGNTSKDKSMFLLEKIGVATVPGSAFYTSDSGNNLVRFCFAKSNEILDKACERLLTL
jgi:aminotransferase